MIYLALIFFLLPVSGWAGDPQIIGKDKPDCMVYEDATLGLRKEGTCTYEDVVDQGRALTYDDLQSDTIATCDMNYRNCEIKKPSAFPCYQRMQEAMKVMTFSLMHVPVAKELGDQIWNFAKRPTEVTQMKEWQQVMKDCVQ